MISARTPWLRRDTTAGLLILVAALVGLTWVNVAPASQQAISTWQLGPLDVAHWANSGLLMIFFFLAGLELKQELTSGSLAHPRKAMVPIASAVGGMAVPALIYLLINTLAPGGDLRGWAVPMATDIAFVMAILGLVGRGLPGALRAFLLTLAIVDDLGAILVIAVAFTGQLHLWWLLGAAAGYLAWWLLQRRGLTSPLLLVPLFAATWWCLHSSGVHATINGVVLGLLTRAAPHPGESQAPTQRWLHFWQPFSAGVVVPVFAVFAAAVPIDSSVARSLTTDPIALGIAAGFLGGKTIGILGTAYLTTRLISARLDPTLRWAHLAAGSVLSAVGFTVALFVADLSFSDDQAGLGLAKLTVLITSASAGVLGGGLLLMLGRRGRTLSTHRTDS